MNTFARSFTLKQRDFRTGKLVSPPREFWKTCDCCGKAIVQGAVMTNGDHIGNDCWEVVQRVPFEIKSKGSADGLFRMFGTLPRVRDYALSAAA